MQTWLKSNPKRRRWRQAACAVSLALAATGISLAQTPPNAPARAGASSWGAGPGPGMGAGWAGGWGHGGRGVERMLDAAGASADQKARVHAIFDGLRKDLRAQFDAGRALHDDMAKLLLAPTLDPAAVEALRQKIEAQHDALSKRATQAMLDASAVLTPEQRGKLAAYMQQRREMFERHRRERESLGGPKG